MSKVDLNDFNTSKCMSLEKIFYSIFSAEHVNYFFTTNSIIVINRFLTIYKIIIVQNLASRYVTMLLLERLKHFRQKIKLFSKSMGNYKLSPARYVTKFGIIIQRW